MKKNYIFNCTVLLIVYSLLLTTGCSKEDDSELTVQDIDGNAYKTVTIGTQTWMAENLRTTTYNDGTDIPNVTDNIEWGDLTTGAYCHYNNTTNVDTVATYGRLYNWYAVNTGLLAPTGWHVPTDDEWTELIDYLGGTSEAGNKLKETGTIHWSNPNAGATNETGFTALPGGYRGSDGSFNSISTNGYWWSATEDNTNTAWGRFMFFNTSNVSSNFGNKDFGFSVRCVKDN